MAEARTVSNDSIRLIFNNIHNRLYTYAVSAKELPFTIQDSEGVVEIVSYEIDSEDTLTLTTKRELRGRCLVHGACKKNPGAVIPVDFASHLPMLSFYGVTAE